MPIINSPDKISNLTGLKLFLQNTKEDPFQAAIIAHTWFLSHGYNHTLAAERIMYNKYHGDHSKLIAFLPVCLFIEPGKGVWNIIHGYEGLPTIVYTDQVSAGGALLAFDSQFKTIRTEILQNTLGKNIEILERRFVHVVSDKPHTIDEFKEKLNKNGDEVDVPMFSMIDEAMKNSKHPIFVIFKHTDGDLFHKVIGKATSSFWAHAAISFDPSLQVMYSFTISQDGFGVENIKNYPTGTKISVMCSMVTDDIYQKMLSAIEKFKKIKNKTSYGYKNFISILMKKPNTDDLTMVCSNFVDYMLKLGDISPTKMDWSTTHPGRLARAIARTKEKSFFKVYRGDVKEYDPKYAKMLINSMSKNDEIVRENMNPTFIPSTHKDMEEVCEALFDHKPAEEMSMPREFDSIELPYFTIAGSYGGNQEWCEKRELKLGGCAAITACDMAIYLRHHKDLVNAYPDSEITRDAYTSFVEKMGNYLKPSEDGITQLNLYIDGFRKYLQDQDINSIAMRSWPGENDVLLTEDVIKHQIDNGWPIPCLTLKNGHPDMQKYNWHWYIINGYRVHGDKFYVKVVTCGMGNWIDFHILWKTDYSPKGGLILFDTATSKPLSEPITESSSQFQMVSLSTAFVKKWGEHYKELQKATTGNGYRGIVILKLEQPTAEIAGFINVYSKSGSIQSMWVNPKYAASGIKMKLIRAIK